MNIYGASSFWIAPGETKVINYYAVVDDLPNTKLCVARAIITLENHHRGVKIYRPRKIFRLR